jgi:hypothetical protein
MTDGWADAVNSANPVKGTLVKCNDGAWLRGKETASITGSQWLALSTREAWVFWKENKPDKYLFRELGRNLPERDELGDLDQDAWEAGPSGQKRDPWQLTKLLYLADEATAELLTYSTATWGGRTAIADLADQIGLMRTTHPRATPVVELQNRPVMTRFGRKTWPVLKVVAWRNLNTPPATIDEIPDME